MAVGRQPRVDLRQRLRVQFIPAPLCILAHMHKLHVAQHTQVLGDAGLADLQQLSQLAD